MKKLLVFAVLVIVGSTASFAQFKYGGGLTLGTEMSVEEDMGVGLNFRGDYCFNDQWSLAPGFTFAFPSSNGGLKYSAWQLNADVHYHFYETEGFGFYGLGGLNYTHEKIKIDGNTPFGSFLVSASDDNLGLDIGGGVNYKMFFGELKYDSAFEQLAITVGVLF